MRICAVWGWLEVSVNVGFLCMDVFRFFGVLWMEMSEWFMMFLSISSVNFKFGCKVLKSIRIAWISVWLETNIR